MKSSPAPYTPMTPYQNEFDSILRNYRIIDVGTILNVSEDKLSATVQGFDVQNGVVKTYKDIEILYPAGVTVGVIGCPCIIFRPATGVQNIQQNTLLGTKSLHPEASIKVVPLFFGKGQNVSLGFNSGNYTISTENYSMSFNELGVDLILGNSAYVSADTDSIGISLHAYNININEEGIIETLYKDVNDKLISRTVYDPSSGDSLLYYGATDEPSDDELDDLDTFTKWSWIKKMSANGTFSIQQMDSDEKVLNALNIDPEGVVQLTTGENIVLDIDQDGNIQVSNNKGTISLDKDGNITFSANGDITVNADGDMKIEAKGKVDIEAKGDATIKGTNVNVEASAKAVVKGINVELNGMTKATGTSFECGGVVAPTGSGALCGLPACLFTGAPHVGNMALGV